MRKKRKHNVAVGTAGVTGDEHSDRSTVNEESGCIVGGDHHARCAHPVDEAGSIVSNVSNDMSEGKKTVKKQARQQQQMRLRRFQKKDVEIRRLIEERRSTPIEEKQRLKEVSNC